jgi:hypothetical protein
MLVCCGNCGSVGPLVPVHHYTTVGLYTKRGVLMPSAVACVPVRVVTASYPFLDQEVILHVEWSADEGVLRECLVLLGCCACFERGVR